MAGKNAIGKDNKLLCFVPGDLKRFREITTGHKIIMGRKTFDSLPKGPLPNRENIVISKTITEIAGCIVVGSVEEAMSRVENDEDAFVIGGGEIYEQCLPIADKIYLTQIDKYFPDADTFFPFIDPEQWAIKDIESHDVGEKNDFEFDYIDLIRRK